mmetsp:Transcript_3436/g.6269  ORF Transcript_3436/g.6269 Transcript_3436/m.6269 type:complete len:215 (+) Transcript_3436:628-1272(+)
MILKLRRFAMLVACVRRASAVMSSQTGSTTTLGLTKTTFRFVPRSPKLRTRRPDPFLCNWDAAAKPATLATKTPTLTLPSKMTPRTPADCTSLAPMMAPAGPAMYNPATPPTTPPATDAIPMVLERAEDFRTASNASDAIIDADLIGGGGFGLTSFNNDLTSTLSSESSFDTLLLVSEFVGESPLTEVPSLEVFKSNGWHSSSFISASVSRSSE